MKKYLCHDCAYALGHDLQWWDSPPTEHECENSTDPSNQHGTGAGLIDLDLPVPPRLPSKPTPTNSFPRPPGPSYKKGAPAHQPKPEPKAAPEAKLDPEDELPKYDPNDIEI